jgi:three-Cys-motif partner protein
LNKHDFGGSWTIEKLNILGKYLEAYTTALKNQRFRKIYIDAFAGTGDVTCKIDKQTEIDIEGSARIALQTKTSFDEYIFIELNIDYAEKLNKLKEEFPEKADKIIIINEDCNTYLKQLCKNTDWYKNRAVLFLDPYGMQVEWNTVKDIANTSAIDLWYLFPFSAVNRLLKKDGKINEKHKERLDKMLGDTNWFKEFYEPDMQLTFFDEDTYYKKVNKESMTNYIKSRLSTTFPAIAQNPRILCNSKNSPLFLFCFAVSNKKKSAQKTALNIAQHILKNS